MKVLLLLLGALVSISSNEPLFIRLQRQGYLTQDDLPQSHHIVSKSNVASPGNDAVYGQCLDVVFNKAQYDFNSATGIEPTLTWRNASSINYKLNQLLFANNSGLPTVCNARQQFSYTLGFSYPACVNRYYLLNKGDTDFTNCVTYVHIYKHLEFICSAAYEFYLYNLAVIYRAQQSAPYQACLTTFVQNNTANPNGFCDNTAQMTTCVQSAATASSNSDAIGWMLCERERVGFAYDCPSIQCKVPGQQ